MLLNNASCNIIPVPQNGSNKVEFSFTWLRFINIFASLIEIALR